MKNILLSLVMMGVVLSPFEKATDFCGEALAIRGWSSGFFTDAKECISDMEEFFIEREESE